MSATPVTDPVEQMRAAYAAWKTQRAALSAQEENGPTPDPDDWAWSDDEAVELLDSAMSLLNQLTATPTQPEDPK